MSDQKTVVSNFLRALLTENQPELGARLKQRLQQSLLENGQPYLDTSSYGYPKFAVYLERIHNDLIRIERDPDASDVLVCLHDNLSLPVLDTQDLPTTKGIIVRSDIWQAFLNPDLQRKRYFDKSSCSVVHFKCGKNTLEERLLADNPDNYIEIHPIDGELQLRWMRDFLNDLPVSQTEKDILAGQVGVKYSSVLNSTFIKSLGIHAELWRKYRIPRVFKILQNWAKDVGISFETLCVPNKKVSINKKNDGHNIPLVHTHLSARELAHRLIDLITEEDLSNLILPSLMSTLLIKSRM